MQYVIGLDYGTQSARAVLVNTADGSIACSHTVQYAHEVDDEALVPIEDYDAALAALLQAVTQTAYRDSIVGICVDATSLTLVPLGADGRALSYQEDLHDRPHAQVKLWKRHAAQKQADEALALAQKRQEPFLRRTGGSISSEWMLPKLMETRDEDPQTYAQMDLAMDLCEYLTYRLTGCVTRSMGSMCYKCLWSQDLGLPSADYLNALRPGLGAEYARMLRGPVMRPGDRAGWLTKEWKEKLSLTGEIAVAAGVLDGHTSLVAMGALQPGDAALVVGTSNVLTIQTPELHEVEGICGMAKDGLTPGLYGVDAGQSCTGDMLGWYVQHAVPGSYEREARQKGLSVHELPTQKIREPWQNKVVAADWWNGSRNAPCNLALPGVMTGLTLMTRPEDIYLALLQAIVCGTGEIIAQCERSGVTTTRLLACGGVSRKNRLLMQEYANLLQREVAVAQADEVPALGAAIFAAVASGVCKTPLEAWESMGIHDFEIIGPDQAHRAEYRALYEKKRRLRQAMM